MKRLIAALAMFIVCAGVQAQDGGLWVNPKEFKPAPPEPAQQVAPAVTENSGKAVVAIASAIGGQLSYVVAKQQTGSRLDPYERTTLAIPDYTLDAIVMRGIDRVVARRFPDTDRVFMRLNPKQLDDVAAPDRERVAFERLTAELQKMPGRDKWDRIVVVTPHYRGFERAGLASKLQGVGVFVQGLNDDSVSTRGHFEVIEPDGTPGASRKNNYIALYYYATLYILDAKTLQVIESVPWLIDEKINNSQSDAVNIAKSLTIDQLSGRIEVFAEKASGDALAKTLRGTVVPGEITPVPPAR
jgi:hypothetical protein